MDTKGLSGAETLLRVLAAMGVERIFASPGSEWAPIWEHLAKPYGSPHEIPRYLSSRHEEIAVGMASGYTKTTGKLPAVMIHTTVGALHATMALRAALHEHVPMVVLAGESIGFGEIRGPDPGHQWLRVLTDTGRPSRLVAPVVEGWHPAFVNFPRHHPLYGGLGRAAHLAGYLKDADLVFLLAAVAPWHPPSSAPGPSTKVAVLSDDPVRSDIPFWGYRSDLAVTGDVEASLGMLVERVNEMVPAGARSGRAERWRAHHQQRRDALVQEGRAAGATSPIDTRWVVRELNEVLPDDATVVDETITHRLDIHRFLDRLTSGRFFSGSYGGLGTGLPTALGVKAAHPERPVVALIGDGSFNYNPVTAAFGAAQEHRLPILIVLFNNSGYLSQKSGVPQHYPEGWAVKSQTFVGTSITPNPDYAALARAFGGYGEKVEKPGEVRAALLRGLQAVASGQLAVLDMRLQPINTSGEV